MNLSEDETKIAARYTENVANHNRANGEREREREVESKKQKKEQEQVLGTKESKNK